MKKNKRKTDTILTISIVLMLILLFAYIFMLSYSFCLTKSYQDKMYPNIFIGNEDISNLTMSEIEKKIDDIEKSFRTQKLTLIADNKKYEYSLSDLGISIDQKTLLKKIKKYHKDMNYSQKIEKIFSPKKKVFSYSVIYQKDTIKKFISGLKETVDVAGRDGSLVMGSDRNLTYQEAISSFNLDVDKTYQEFIKYIDQGIKTSEFNLIGDVNHFKESEVLKTINTKVSTYSTRYKVYISRGRNLEAALNYLDGTIIKSGEVFSYFNIAGPYHKKGYVNYDDVVGNGACQIASTIYNTALLSGVQIVERHPHQKYMPYVPGGQDATVLSSGNYSLLDFKFKNTYKYPIYISAFYSGGVATVEFWSNQNAKEGKEYKVSSVSLGNRTYQTYLHTYENGVEINKTPIAKTHYPKVDD